MNKDDILQKLIDYNNNLKEYIDYYQKVLEQMKHNDDNDLVYFK